MISKLLAHGHFIGDDPDPEPDNPNRKDIDRVLQTVADAFQGVNTDEGVQLQIIKTLLTAVSSPHISVHETTLLNSGISFTLFDLTFWNIVFSEVWMKLNCELSVVKTEYKFVQFIIYTWLQSH